MVAKTKIYLVFCRLPQNDRSVNQGYFILIDRLTDRRSCGKKKNYLTRMRLQSARIIRQGP